MKSNKNAKTFNKPVTKTLPVVVPGCDAKGNEYDIQSALDLLANLQEAKVFERLSVMVSASTALIIGKEDAKGTMRLAAIKSFDVEKCSMDLTFFGRNIENANAVDGLVIVPRVRFDREGVVFSISGFDVIREDN